MAFVVTYDQLHQLTQGADNPAVSQQLVAPLQAMLSASPTINTKLRRCHFLAQVCYESGFFSRLVENLNYSHADRIAAEWPRLAPRADALVNNPEALANAAYAAWTDSNGQLHDILGNGPEGNGNGWAYRGRGLIQLTGKSNYTRFSRPDLDIVGQPDLAAIPANAVRLAASFWNAAGCNDGADRDSVSDVTVRINSAKAGLSDRVFLTARAKTIFS